MKHINIDIQNALPFVGEEAFEKTLQEAVEAKGHLLAGDRPGSDFLGWVDLPEQVDAAAMDRLQADVQRLRQLGRLMVVVGIGGSYLGARMVIEALQPEFAPALRGDSPMVAYAGHTLGEDYYGQLLRLLDREDYTTVVISKSGTTTEPAVAFRIVKAHMEHKYGREGARERIVAVTDARRGALRTIAEQEGYPAYIIPDNVGGRFSVLTPVGLLPIAAAGLDVERLLEGARQARRDCLAEGVPHSNAALVYAAIRNALYRQGTKVEMLVSSQPGLRYLAEWWKQLYGESEGKEGKGLLPHSLTITTDLHSMGQYVQEGERLMMETVLDVEGAGAEVTVPTDEANLDGMNYLSGRRLSAVNDCAVQGTIEAHVAGGVPVVALRAGRMDEYTLGQLIYFFEFACGVSGYVLGVNPFDQPGVEAYKRNMFRLLGKPGC